MNGKYSSLNLGQALQKIELLNQKESPLELIRKHWASIMPELMHNMTPTRYIEYTKSLYVTTTVPVMYIQQYSENVRQICNTFFGQEMVKAMHFVYRRY